MQGKLQLSFKWPSFPDESFREEFLLGAWHPSAHLEVSWSPPPPPVEVSSIEGRNWFLLSSGSPFQPNRNGLVHVSRWEHSSTGDQATEAVLFRGYVLEPPIHSWSEPQKIVDYWREEHGEHNGVFAAVCIRDSGHALELITDVFGMAPLYYRALGDLVLFSTNPRYLTSDHDEPDYMAWRCLIQSGFIAGDRTLAVQIKRVPAGQLLRFQGSNVQYSQWFDYARLPDGSQRVDEDAIIKFEEAFQTALSRCLQLQTAGTILPLSSGHDSRRILAGLLHRKVSFEAITASTLLKENRNLDAKFASLMARDLGFPHRVIESQYPIDSWEYAREYARYDRQRRVLLAGECYGHTWAVPLMHSLPKHSTIFLDGLAGDALGNSGFVIAGLHESPEADRYLITQDVIGTNLDKILHGKRWPSVHDTRREILDYIESLPAGFNQAELAFLLLHTRRAIAPWAQQMLPAGHVVVCPYLELDYIRTALSYHPGEKYRVFLQRKCLETYWPRYFTYPGTRDIPVDIPPGSPRLTYLRDLACFRQLQQELLDIGEMPTLTQLLNTEANLRLLLARVNGRLAVREAWRFVPLMELVAQHTETVACWNVIEDK